MFGRGVGPFWLGFASGALFIATLVSLGAARRQSAGQAYQADASEPPGIGLPIAGLRPEDISDTFNESRDGRRHEATDIMAPRGTPVLAVVSGTIRKLFTSRAGGLTVYQFDAGEIYCYYYAHLDRYAEGLVEGMAVRRGDRIGSVGSTGNANPEAPHLHFAIFELGPEKHWWRGKAIDPYPFLVEALKKQGHAGALVRPGNYRRSGSAGQHRTRNPSRPDANAPLAR